MQLLAAVNDFVFQIAFNCRLVDDILLASVSQSHEVSSKQAQVPFHGLSRTAPHQ